MDGWGGARVEGKQAGRETNRRAIGQKQEESSEKEKSIRRMRGWGFFPMESSAVNMCALGVGATGCNFACFAKRNRGLSFWGFWGVFVFSHAET